MSCSRAASALQAGPCPSQARKTSPAKLPANGETCWQTNKNEQQDAARARNVVPRLSQAGHWLPHGLPSAGSACRSLRVAVPHTSARRIAGIQMAVARAKGRIHNPAWTVGPGRARLARPRRAYLIAPRYGRYASLAAPAVVTLLLPDRGGRTEGPNSRSGGPHPSWRQNRFIQKRATAASPLPRCPAMQPRRKSRSPQPRN